MATHHLCDYNMAVNYCDSIGSSFDESLDDVLAFLDYPNELNHISAHAKNHISAYEKNHSDDHLESFNTSIEDSLNNVLSFFDIANAQNSVNKSFPVSNMLYPLEELDLFSEAFEESRISQSEISNDVNNNNTFVPAHSSLNIGDSVTNVNNVSDKLSEMLAFLDFPNNAQDFTSDEDDPFKHPEFDTSVKEATSCTNGENLCLPGTNISHSMVEPISLSDTLIQICEGVETNPEVFQVVYVQNDTTSDRCISMPFTEVFISNECQNLIQFSAIPNDFVDSKVAADKNMYQLVEPSVPFIKKKIRKSRNKILSIGIEDGEEEAKADVDAEAKRKADAKAKRKARRMKKKTIQPPRKKTQSINKYKCQLCTDSFQSRSLYTEHQAIHADELPFQCDLCPRRYITNQAMQKHRKLHVREVPECDECHKRFSCQDALKRHVQIHAPVSFYKCSHCGKEFLQQDALKSHMFVHTGENGFKCDKCDKKFSRKFSLSLHKSSVHDKVRSYQCELCNKCFLRKNTFSSHMFLHTGEKPFKCTICSRTFAAKRYLDLHFPLCSNKSESQDGALQIVP